jgi:hypothetical protein
MSREQGQVEHSMPITINLDSLLEVFSNYGSYDAFIWSFFPFYLLDVVGLLSPTIKLEVSQEAEKYGAEDWHQVVELALDVRADFLKSVYTNCLEKGMTEMRALLVVVHGLDFPTDLECRWVTELLKEIIDEDLS